MLQAVVDCGGFAQAAEHLHRSQSAISYTIARMQEQLGMRLLRIEGRKARLTELGQALLHRSRHLLQQAQNLEQFAHSLEQGWEAEVRLVVDTAFPTACLMRALRCFEPLSQGTRIKLTEVVLSGAEDALAQGEADLAICSHVPTELLGESLIRIRFIAVSHPEHPLQRLGRQVTVNDMQHELQVVIRDSGLHHRRTMGWLGAEHQWSVSGFETAVMAVCEGLGYAWLPEHRIDKRLEEKQLLPLPMEIGGSYEADLYLVSGQKHSPGPGTRLLEKVLRETVAGEQAG